MSVKWNLRGYTKEEFSEAWLSSSSISQCAQKLNLVKNGGTYKSLKSAAKSLDLTTNHMSVVYDPSTNKSQIPLDRILVEDSDYSTSGLRKRLISTGILPDECSSKFCPNPKEYPHPETGVMVKTKLSLDHINGNNRDHRIENLRILCYNCHALTDTFCGANSTNKVKRICQCGSIKDYKAKTCSECHKSKPTTLAEYSDEYLLNGVRKLGWLPFAKRLDISDNGLRKEIDRRGLERPKIPRGPKKCAR